MHEGPLTWPIELYSYFNQFPDLSNHLGFFMGLIMTT